YGAVVAAAVLLAAVFGSVCCASGCNRQEPEGAPPDPGATPMAEPPSAPAPAAWFEGMWHGDLELEVAAPQEGAGLPAQWKSDPGGVLGPARLSLSVDGNGVVQGALSGENPLIARGILQEETLRIALEPRASSTPSERTRLGL